MRTGLATCIPLLVMMVTHNACGAELGIQPQTERFSNGRIRKIWNVKDGKLEGTEIFFYPSGSVQAIQMYQNGVRHGQAITFHENNEIESICEFKNDRRVGEWRAWHVNGKLKYTIIFDSGGVPIGEEHYWDDDGVQLSTGSFKNGEPHNGLFLKVIGRFTEWREFKDGKFLKELDLRNLRENKVKSIN